MVRPGGCWAAAHTMKAVSLLLLVATVLWPPATFATAPAVRYVDGRLTADLQGAQLADVLDAVASQTGLEMRGTPTPRSISVRLDAVPLAEALPRLLEGQSFALTYDRRGGLKGVRFLGASTAMPPAPPAAAQAANPPAVGESGDVAPSNRPVPIQGLLAEALGSDQSTFYQIMGVALQVGDARLRRDALRTCLRLLNADPELREEAVRAVDSLDDAFLADRLTEIAGANAKEIARRTARVLRSRELRRRAVAVEQLLPAIDPAGGS
jgi:hypothetical protein